MEKQVGQERQMHQDPQGQRSLGWAPQTIGKPSADRAKSGMAVGEKPSAPARPRSHFREHSCLHTLHLVPVPVILGLCSDAS